MQMLVAGGLHPLTDGERAADSDNPRGYYEWEPIKQLPNDPKLIAQADGKVVKVISTLLMNIPDSHEYRVIFMRRPIEQVLASQTAMIKRLGGSSTLPPAVMQQVLESHVRQVSAWLKQRECDQIRVLWVDYVLLMADPASQARRMASFVGVPMDVDAMPGAVDASLWRQRK
jgi:hypothetical protein